MPLPSHDTPAPADAVRPATDASSSLGWERVVPLLASPETREAALAVIAYDPKLRELVTRRAARAADADAEGVSGTSRDDADVALLLDTLIRTRLRAQRYERALDTIAAGRTASARAKHWQSDATRMLQRTEMMALARDVVRQRGRFDSGPATAQRD